MFLFQSTVASAADAGAARVQLQQGYELKQAGKCEEAIPYFVESIRLDRQPKALIHLADCERELGKYVAAEAHLVAARDVGRELALSGFVTVAEGRLTELEAHLPRLTIRLTADAPAQATVTRDGVVLAPLSLGVALPVDPGAHEVRVRGGGLERLYSVELSDSEKKELLVTSIGGQPAPEAPPTPAANPPSALGRPGVASATSTTDGASAGGTRSTRQTLGLVAIGVGVAGLTAGTFFGFKVLSKNQDADGACTGTNPCSSDGLASYRETLRDAKSARTASIVGFAAGGALLAAGGVLFFTASPASREALKLSPIIGANTFGAAAERAW